MRVRVISIGILVFGMSWLTFSLIVSQSAAPILLGVGLGVGWTVLFIFVSDAITYAKAARRYRPRPRVHAPPDNRTVKSDANIVSLVSHPKRPIVSSATPKRRGYLVDFMAYRARRP